MKSIMNANGKDIAEWRPKLLRSAVSSLLFLFLCRPALRRQKEEERDEMRLFFFSSAS